MVKAKASDIKRELEEEQKGIYGDRDDLESDDDVEEMYEEVVGHKPKAGKTLADEIKKAEDVRRGKRPHKAEEEEE